MQRWDDADQFNVGARSLWVGVKIWLCLIFQRRDKLGRATDQYAELGESYSLQVEGMLFE